jgi:glycosyl transferase family 25
MTPPPEGSYSTYGIIFMALYLSPNIKRCKKNILYNYMSPLLPHIFYINLDKRTDRRQEIEAQLRQYNLYDQSERFPALETPDLGILGCTMSHLAVLKLARERQYPHVLILEDDFCFTIPPEEFQKNLQHFFNTIPTFDVCMISYNIKQSHPTDDPRILKIIEAQTASGYIVNQTLYDQIITLYEEAVPLLRDTREHWNYANDQIWKRLQPNTNWFALNPRCGKQRDGFSDNSGQYLTNDW